MHHFHLLGRQICRGEARTAPPQTTPYWGGETPFPHSTNSQPLAAPLVLSTSENMNMPMQALSFRVSSVMAV